MPQLKKLLSFFFLLDRDLIGLFQSSLFFPQLFLLRFETTGWIWQGLLIKLFNDPTLLLQDSSNNLFVHMNSVIQIFCLESSSMEAKFFSNRCVHLLPSLLLFLSW